MNPDMAEKFLSSSMVYTSYVYWKNKGCLLFLWCFDMYSCYNWTYRVAEGGDRYL